MKETAELILNASQALTNILLSSLISVIKKDSMTRRVFPDEESSSIIIPTRQPTWFATDTDTQELLGELGIIRALHSRMKDSTVRFIISSSMIAS